MEELGKLHKDVPFGWVAMMQDFLTARAAARRGRRVTQAACTFDRAASVLPGDLHHLAGPH